MRDGGVEQIVQRSLFPLPFPRQPLRFGDPVGSHLGCGKVAVFLPISSPPAAARFDHM
jgi:hypothetical protein